MYMIEMSRCKRVILALISGLLVSASFPFYLAGFSAPDMGWIAWFALVPLFVAIRARSQKSFCSPSWLPSSGMALRFSGLEMRCTYSAGSPCPSPP